MWYMCVCVCVCVCIHNGILLSHKKNGILPFATTWMDLECVMLNELFQQRQILYVVTCMCNLNNK